jgi:hypothetical protein
MGTFNDATMTWNASPTNVDRDRSRLWDWTDNPIFRGLRANRDRTGFTSSAMSHLLYVESVVLIALPSPAI